MKVRISMVLVSLCILLPSFGSAQGGWITIPAQDFDCNSSNSAYQWKHLISTGGESYLYKIGSATTAFLAPMSFPQEANGLSVRQMNATVGDFGVNGAIEVRLYRMNRFSGVAQLVFSAFTSASGTPGKTVLTDTTGGFRLIDSQKYAWFVKVDYSGDPSPDSNLRLYAVRIQYQ